MVKKMCFAMQKEKYASFFLSLCDKNLCKTPTLFNKPPIDFDLTLHFIRKILLNKGLNPGEQVFQYPEFWRVQ